MLWSILFQYVFLCGERHVVNGGDNNDDNIRVEMMVMMRMRM